MNDSLYLQTICYLQKLRPNVSYAAGLGLEPRGVSLPGEEP